MQEAWRREDLTSIREQEEKAENPPQISYTQRRRKRDMVEAKTFAGKRKTKKTKFPKKTNKMQNFRA